MKVPAAEYGFSEDGSSGDEVLVWAVHTVVHTYPSLSVFAKEHLIA